MRFCNRSFHKTSDRICSIIRIIFTILHGHIFMFIIHKKIRITLQGVIISVTKTLCYCWKNSPCNLDQAAPHIPTPVHGIRPCELLILFSDHLVTVVGVEVLPTISAHTCKESCPSSAWTRSNIMSAEAFTRLCTIKYFSLRCQE